jgi:hypothetical protein
MNEKMAELYETKQRYQEATPDVVYPITYAEWKKLPEEYKASALFVTFFDAIAKAVNKRSYVHISGSDVISAIMSTLLTRSIKTIENDPKTYTAAYICRITQNAIIDCDKCDPEKKISAVSVSNLRDDIFGEEYDYFDTIADDSISRTVSHIIWENWDTLSNEAQNYVTHVLQNRKIPAADKKQLNKTLSELRTLLEAPATLIDIHLDCDTFEDVLSTEDLIEEATVIMPDGTEAYYYGDKKYLKNGSVKYIFIGENSNYCLTEKVSRPLKVVNVIPIT